MTGPASDVGQSRANRTAETTTAVVDATIALLEEVGEQGLRIADVHKRSGVSVGSIYHHFVDRDGLIKAARTRQFRESQPTFGTDIASAADSSSSKAEFLKQLTEVIRAVQYPDEVEKRQQRIVDIASAVTRPDLRSELVAQHTELVTAASAIGQSLIDRGWVKDGVTARALATFALAIDLGSVVVGLDAEGLREEEWRHVVYLASQGLLVEDDG